MRISGRSGSETLMFIAPAAILGVVFVWMNGDPAETLGALDRLVLHGLRVAAGLWSALMDALSKL